MGKEGVVLGVGLSYMERVALDAEAKSPSHHTAMAPESFLWRLVSVNPTVQSLGDLQSGLAALLMGCVVPRRERRSVPGPGCPGHRGGHGAEGRRERPRLLRGQHPGASGRPALHWLLRSEGSGLWREGKALLLGRGSVSAGARSAAGVPGGGVF